MITISQIEEAFRSMDDLPQSELEEYDGMVDYWESRDPVEGKSEHYYSGYARAYATGEALTAGSLSYGSS